jgi:hypothetical protein
LRITSCPRYVTHRRSLTAEGPPGPDRPAEAAAQPPSEGKGGLKK